MTPKGRVMTILLALVSVAALGAAGVAVMLQRQEHTLRLAKERQVTLLKAEKDDLEQQLGEVRQAKEQIAGELSQAKETLAKKLQELAEEHQAKETLAKSVDDRQREIDRLGKDLEQIRNERGTLTDQLTQLKGQDDQLRAQLTELQDTKTKLETKLSQASNDPTVQLDKVVVTNGTSTGAAAAPANTSPGGLQGQVVVVNREYDFIVMSLGKNQGLQIGQEFQIVRGEEVLGRVKVEKVYDELSAAAILPQSKKDAIREGDLVKSI